jgi:hypothetical protein
MRHSIRKLLRRAFDALLLALAVANLFLSLPSIAKILFPPIPYHAIPVLPSDPRNSSISETFTESELGVAIRDLHLPVWSRGFVPCDSPASEVTCSQIFRAWKLLNSWSVSQKAGFESVGHVLVRHAHAGLGNRFSTGAAAFVIALAGNRSFSVEASYPAAGGRRLGQAFDLHPAVALLNRSAAGAAPFPIAADAAWFAYDFAGALAARASLAVGALVYATMPYANAQLAALCYAHFGRHMVYFVSNFLMRLPAGALREAAAALAAVPRGVRVFGVHLRFHRAGRYFAYSEPRTMRSVLPFLRFASARRPTVFAFASDSALLASHFAFAFPRQTVTTRALRRSDRDHASALFDLALLEMAEERLLTYRSTFSYVAMARTARRAWFVDKETRDVFHVSNSQAAVISMLFHQFDVNDWQTARRFRISDGVEAAFRRYFKFFVL